VQSPLTDSNRRDGQCAFSASQLAAIPGPAARAARSARRRSSRKAVAPLINDRRDAVRGVLWTLM
jgi:hypothetical protein